MTELHVLTIGQYLFLKWGLVVTLLLIVVHIISTEN